MAEIFGAVAGAASIVSLAADLYDCAFKLKEFAERFKGAKVSLRELSHEIKSISLVLYGLEGYRQMYSHDSMALERCVMNCHEKIESIRATVEKLQQGIERSPVLRRAQWALRQPEAELLSKIERVKSSIVMEILLYSLYG